MKKKILTSCCFGKLTFQSWASQDFPVEETNINAPPDIGTINTFLPTAPIIASFI